MDIENNLSKQSENTSQEQDSISAGNNNPELQSTDWQVPTLLLNSDDNDLHKSDEEINKCIIELKEIVDLISKKHKKYVIASMVSKHAVLVGISTLLIDKTESFFSPKNGMLLIICGTLSTTGFYYCKRSAEQKALFDAIGKLDVLIQSLNKLNFQPKSENIQESAEKFLGKFKTNYNMTNAFAVIPVIATFFFSYTQMCDESKLAGTILTGVKSIFAKKYIDRNIVFKSSLFGILIVGFTNIYYFLDYDSESSLSKSIKNLIRTLQKH